MLSGILSKQTSEDLLEEELAQLPHNFQLNQNFPNPFNPSTTISYLLKKNSEAKLSVYNLKGQLVKTLVNQTVQQGKHSVLWDGTEEFGKQAASSVYFYKLETGDFSQTKKMLLLK